MKLALKGERVEVEWEFDKFSLVPLDSLSHIVGRKIWLCAQLKIRMVNLGRKGNIYSTILNRVVRKNLGEMQRSNINERILEIWEKRFLERRNSKEIFHWLPCIFYLSPSVNVQRVNLYESVDHKWSRIFCLCCSLKYTLWLYSSKSQLIFFLFHEISGHLSYLSSTM